MKKILLGLILLLGFSSYTLAQTVPLPVTVMNLDFDGTLTNTSATEAGDAKIMLDADQGDDNADLWTIQSTASDNDLDFINHITTVGSLSSTGALTLSADFITTYMKLTPQAGPPGSPASGHIYVDSTPAADELCFYDGAAWQGISSGTDANCA